MVLSRIKFIFSSALLAPFFALYPVAFAQEPAVSEKSIYDNYFEATKPVTEVLNSQIHKFSDALLRQTTMGQRAEQAREQQQLKRDIQTKRVVRSVKDCIKPNGLIDDEVQMCVNGTREKTW